MCCDFALHAVCLLIFTISLNALFVMPCGVNCVRTSLRERCALCSAPRFSVSHVVRYREFSRFPFISLSLVFDHIFLQLIQLNCSLFLNTDQSLSRTLVRSLQTAVRGRGYLIRGYIMRCYLIDLFSIFSRGGYLMGGGGYLPNSTVPPRLFEV